MLNNNHEAFDDFINAGGVGFDHDSLTEQVNPYVAMVSDAFVGNMEELVENMEEEPNAEAKKFFHILDAAKNPIYDGCKDGLSQLSLAARLMSLKTDYNLPQNCMDSISQMVDVFWSILEHMGHEEHGGTWHMEAAQLDTQRKKGEAILKTSSTVYSTNRSSSSTRPAKLQLDRAGSQSQTRKMLLPP
ncbi:unnamed protein product [Microthlaspi erraticum]|uniref:Uncharacterized protein n=1 Tax=Microthlaspi erraticum TaxID=1685480 RepID=A0A6D2JAA5_9BRAS|nr:unnamed protein product [Microthlaspi erraticum]